MIRYLRIELVDGKGGDESENFEHVYSHRIKEMSKLERCDVLVGDLDKYTSSIEEREWGMCTRGNVRIVDGETNGGYRDYRATDKGETRRCVIEVYEIGGGGWR
jgi:hypothetical protein